MARLRLTITVLGALALAWALARVLNHPEELLPSVLGVMAVAVAALFPIRIPGTTASISAADAFIVSLLAVLGAPVAVLAAGVDTFIGAVRTSTRLSSRLCSPAAAIAAMTARGLIFECLLATFARWGIESHMALFGALGSAARAQWVFTTAPVNGVIFLKRGPSMRSSTKCSSVRRTSRSCGPFRHSASP